MVFCNEKRRYIKGLRQKKGASLPMVVIIGVALVIWVLALLPLMVTSGEQGIETAQMEQEYLDSRSAIEFCKSELMRIVETGFPYTFVVKDGGNYAYTAIPKRQSDGVTPNPDYSGCITVDSSDDSKDIPKDTTEGKNVVAICAVEQVDGQYDITIKTYCEGKPGLTYSTYYVLGGNMLIYPESYKQTQALPLSDFVVVDGKLGAERNEYGAIVYDPNTGKWEVNKVWKSNINTTSELNYQNYLEGTVGSARHYDAAYEEILNPWKVEPISSYSNTGRFPAVFKTTAQASNTGAGIDMAEWTAKSPEAWIMPQGTDFGLKSDGTIKISESGNLSGLTLSTFNHKVYYNGENYNGEESKPTKPGIYQVIVDYEGTLGNGYREGQKNVLPAQGLVLEDYIFPNEPKTQEITNYGISSVNGTTVKLFSSGFDSENTSIVYGCTPLLDATGKATGIHWQKLDTFNLSSLCESYKEQGWSLENDFYFFCYAQSYVDKESGYLYKQSQIYTVGTVYYYDAKTADDLTESGNYLIVNGSGKRLYLQESSMLLDNSSALLGYSDKWLANPGYIWTLENGADGWTIKNGDNYAYVNYSRTGRGWDWWPYNYNNFKLQFSTSKSHKFQNNEKAFYVALTLPKYDSVNETYKKYLSVTGGYSPSWLSDSLPNNDSMLYFVKIPTAKTVDAGEDKRPNIDDLIDDLGVISLTGNYGYKIETFKEALEDKLEEYGIELESSDSVLLNSVSYEDSYKLKSGKYSITANVKKGNYTYGVNLGTLTVDRRQSTLTGSLSVNVQGNTAKLTYSARRDRSNGDYYYGYRYNGVDYWFPTNQLRYIPDGTREFMVAQSDTVDYLSGSVKEYTLAEDKAVSGKITLDGIPGAKAMFLYTVDASNGNITWYRLPEGVSPVEREDYAYITKIWYGKESEGGGINWSETYSAGVTKYAINVAESDYTTSLFELGAPLQMESPTRGHYPSYLKGQTMYFMGGDKGDSNPNNDYSINTYGNYISLHTDLLVLNQGITDGNSNPGIDGSVYVYPYKEGAKTVMLFVVNSFSHFKEKNFYEIPAGTDLLEVSPSQANDWLCHDDTGDLAQGTKISREGNRPDGRILSIEFPQEVKRLFANKYPMINLDIAYATNEQLAYIVSGETMGWTEAGILSESSDANNPSYVVCAYVEKMEGDISYRANRVMLAAERALSVPAELRIWTRYMSIDSPQIIQGSANASFWLNNILKDADFIQSILGDIFGDHTYNSGTLQVDYETDTDIVLYGSAGVAEMKAQICRYEADATNLFVNAEGSQSLTVKYDAGTVSSIFASSNKGLVMVDRYISMQGNNLTAKAADGISLVIYKNMSIYTNYLEFSNSLNTIVVNNYLGGWAIIPILPHYGDIHINSQESGYTTEEYLGLFRVHSAESYNGTLIRFQNDTNVYIWETAVGDATGEFLEPPYKIPKGFYYVPATDSGTSLLQIAKDIHAGKTTGNGSSKVEYIPDDQLSKYSITINKDGSTSQSWVDTGILNGAGTEAGFGGGTVK